ncbi:MAG: COX15/CtaA family protein [Planctomycetota bacterium]
MTASVASAPRGPFLLAIALLAVTTLVILMGAMTTSTGSGMAFLDWPMSDGQLMPERAFHEAPAFFEHFHRVIAASAGLLAVWLCAWLVLRRVGPGAARGTAAAGLLVIIVQGTIGGLGVLKNLPYWSSITHGTLAQLTLATFACVAWQLSGSYLRTSPATGVPAGTGRKVAVIAVVALVLQTILGAIARHSNSAHALWTHVANAFVVFLVVVVATGFAMGRLGRTPGLRPVAKWLSGLLILQIVLGFVALLIRNQAGKTPENVANLGTALLISAHVLLGATLTVLATTMAAQVFRASRRPDAAPGPA